MNFTVAKANSRRFNRYLLPVFLLLAFSGFLPERVFAQDLAETKISVSFNKTTLKEALKQIEAAAAVTISYIDEDISHVSSVSGRFDQKSVQYILGAILEKYNLSYRQMGSNIFINKKEKVREVKKGVITGKVSDATTKEPLIGVTVIVGNITGTTTDIEGNFRVEVPFGNYELRADYIGYQPFQKSVTVSETKSFFFTIEMTEDKNMLNEVTVRSTRQTLTNIALIYEIRNARAIVSGISGEQIRRTQDRDASDVVRRIPGVSVMQNRFIVVRGLPQRYNTVMLNDAIAPSFEADSRAFSFDIIPSNMIDRVVIYKTALPELPGDFAGGVVKVYTTGMPAKDGFNINFQTSVRPNTTFRPFFEQPQGSLASLGYDDGTYAMPKNVPSPISDRAAATPSFNNNWDAEEKTAPLDYRLGLDFSKILPLSSHISMGITGGLSYANTYQYTVVSRNVGLYDKTVGKYRSAYVFSDQTYSHAVRLNGLLNLSLDINGKHRINIKNLYTHIGAFEYVNRNGRSNELAGDGTGLYPNQLIQQMILTNSFREITSTQLSGRHDLFKNTRLNWIAAYTKSNYDDPDQRRRTIRAEDGISGTGAWHEGVGNNDVSAIDHSRFYYRLPEETKTFGLDIEHKFNISQFKPTLKAGLYLEDKSRTFELRMLGLVQDDFLNKVVIGELYYPWNSYTATNNLYAGYLAAEIPFLKNFKLYGGVRMEDNRQQLHSYTPAGGIQKVDLNNHSVTWLPSANLSYDLTSKSLLRLAYSQTLNRPEFREIAPFYFYDLRNFTYAFGNPSIKPQVDIYNYDLRYELYPGLGEMLSFGVFYKKFINPIEFFYYNSTTGRNSFMWGNAASAVNYGAEIDMILSMGRLLKAQHTGWAATALQRMTLLFNAAYVYSEVNLGDRTNTFIQDKKRPLFGQSPYTINASLNYTDDSAGFKLNIAYNIIGKRIIAVGNIDNPDVYELPRHQLDITFSKKVFRKFEIRGGVQNLLNARFLQMQDSNGDGKFSIGDNNYSNWQDNRYLSWYGGTYFTLGLGLQL